MTDKEQKGRYLLSELGGIDDDLLYEATDLYPAARKKKRHDRTVALVCAVAAVMILLAPIGTVGTFIFTVSEFINITLKGDTEPPAEQPPAIQYEQNQITSDLFFGGRPLLMWQEQNDTVFHVLPIDRGQLSTITRLMTESTAKNDGDEAITKKIWICDGEGLVKTPYLEDTPGNLYYATLFDYDPELVLTEELEDRLAELTS